MNPMPGESIKEVASTREGRRSMRRLVSQEFLFLLERINHLNEKVGAELKRLDEKFTAEIKRLDEKLTGEIKRLEARFDEKIERLETRFDEKFEQLNDKFDSAKLWFMGTVVTIIAAIIGSRFI